MQIGRGGKRGREKSTCRRNWFVASCMPPTRALACNQGMCPTEESENQTGDLLLCGPAPNQLSYTGQGFFFFNLHPRICSLISKKGEGREWKRERNIVVRETLTGCLLHILTGTELQPRCVPWSESNQDLSVYWRTLQTTQPHWPGPLFFSLLL